MVEVESALAEALPVLQDLVALLRPISREVAMGAFRLVQQGYTDPRLAKTFASRDWLVLPSQVPAASSSA